MKDTVTRSCLYGLSYIENASKRKKLSSKIDFKKNQKINDITLIWCFDPQFARFVPLETRKTAYPPNMCACPMSGPGLPTSHVVVFFMFSGFSWAESWLFVLLIFVELITITVKRSFHYYRIHTFSISCIYKRLVNLNGSSDLITSPEYLLVRTTMKNCFTQLFHFNISTSLSFKQTKTYFRNWQLTSLFTIGLLKLIQFLIYVSLDECSQGSTNRATEIGDVRL